MLTDIARQRPAEAVRDDPQELRRCIRDLLALSALPALWTNHDGRRISESVAEALLSMLDPEFVYIILPGRRDEPVIEVMRTRNEAMANSPSVIRWAMLEQLPRQPLDATAEIPDPLGRGTIRIACTPIGVGRDAILIAGSGRSGFPNDVQHLILRMAANQTAIAVARWHAETDQRRFTALVERSADFIGLASLEGVPQYVNPAGLKLVGLDGMDAARGAHVLDFVMPGERARMRDELWPLVLRGGAGSARSPSGTSGPERRSLFWSTGSGSTTRAPDSR